MPKPRFAHELAQALYVCTWLGPSIPKLSELKHDFVELVDLKGSTLKTLKSKNIIINWTPGLNLAWKKLIFTIYVASKGFLRNYDSSKELCLFSDANDLYWSLVICMAETEDLMKQDVKLLRPKPMMFLSGKFSKTQQRWHISQKEIYPIIYSFKRIPFLVMGHPKRVNVYTDHRNLKPILEAGLNPNKIHLQRLNRWGMLIQNADLNIFHISSEENALADLFTRWGAVEDTALSNKLEPPEITHFSQLPIMQHRLGENVEIQQVKKDKKDKTKITKINNLQLNMPVHEDDISSTDSSDSELLDHTENNQIVEDIFPSIAPETKAMLKRLEQDRISYLNPFYVGARQRDIYKEI